MIKFIKRIFCKHFYMSYYTNDGVTLKNYQYHQDDWLVKKCIICGKIIEYEE